MSIVAERIRARLEKLGISPRAASLRAGRQPYTVRDILSGKNENPKTDLILDLARVLVCSTDYLLGLSDDPGAAPGARIEPQLAEVLHRIPPDKQSTAKRLLEALAEPAHRRPKPAKKKAKAKKH